jgi:hypothetical protein
MPIDPPEEPPLKPGQPTEPPPESPPGNPRPEVPPPAQEPDAPARPDELPSRAPDEFPVRGPQGPTTPSPATDIRAFVSAVRSQSYGPIGDLEPRFDW